MPSKKIKKEPLKRKIEQAKFEATHIKFNFSFINYDKDFNDEHKIQFVKRLFDLSKESYLVVASWGKEIGFENIKLDIKKEIMPSFFNGNRQFDGKYTVIRLYPNNNPFPSRIIGKMINKIFYVFFIDICGNLYKH